MPFTALRPNQKATDKVRQAAIDYDREQRARDAAIAESGRDPFTVRLESQIPLNRAFEADRAAGGGLTGFLSGASQLLPGMQFRGGMGDPMDVLGPLMKRISGVARGMNTKNAEDLSQQGTEAVLNTMKEKSLSGPEAVGVARNAMRNYMRVQQGGQGVRRGAEATAVRNAVDQFGHQNEFQQLYQARKAAPGLTIDEFRRIRDQMAATKRPVSIDAPIREGESTSMADLLRNTEDPAEAAMLNERYNTLTDAQKANLDKHLSGETIHRQILDRILKKMGMRAPTKPISGGSAADMSVQEYIERLRAERARVQGGGNPTRFEGSETPLPTDAKPRIFESDSRPSRGPATLFHATPTGPGIRDTGMLEGRTGVTSGGLGGSGKPGVSTTTNLDEAMESARLMQRAGYVSRQGLPDNLLDEMILTDLARSGQPATPEMLRQVRSRMVQPGAATPYAPPPGQETPGTMGVERLRNYMGQRNNHLNPFDENPGQAFPRDPYMVMPDDPAEYALKMNRLNKVTPEGIRVAKIPQDAIPPKAMVTGGADPGEIQVMSDIPGRLIQLLKPSIGSLLGFAGLNTLRNQPQEVQQ